MGEPSLYRFLGLMALVRSKTVLGSKRLVFENDFTEGLVVRWKRTRDFGTYHQICKYTKNLMDSIVIGSKFSRNAPLQDILGNMFLSMERWLDRWVPGKGTLYSYLSTCIKHACISFVTKEVGLRQRQVLVGDTPMESLGATYVMDFDDAPDLVTSITSDLECRWSDPEIRDAIRYVADEILRNGGVKHRKAVLQTMSLAFDLGAYTDAGHTNEMIDVARFIVDWTHAAIRKAWLDHHSPPIRQYDVARLATRFSFLPDLIEVVGLESATRLMSVFAGMSVRFPTQSSWQRTRAIGEAYEAYLADPSPEVISYWAKQVKVPVDRMASILEAWAANAQAGVLNDIPVNDDA